VSSRQRGMDGYSANRVVARVWSSRRAQASSRWNFAVSRDASLLRMHHVVAFDASPAVEPLKHASNNA
jgi:hypothetical protein